MSTNKNDPPEDARYSNIFDVDAQAEAEVAIASFLVNNTTAEEQVAYKLSHEIVKKVLWRFRKDLFK